MFGGGRVTGCLRPFFLGGTHLRWGEIYSNMFFKG